MLLENEMCVFIFEKRVSVDVMFVLLIIEIVLFNWWLIVWMFGFVWWYWMWCF